MTRSARGWLRCWLAVAGALVLLAGCFDSLVGSPCAAGYALVGGHCIDRESLPDGGPGRPDGPGEPEDPDSGTPVNPPDAGDGSNGSDGGPGPDALVCVLPELECHGVCIDVSSDPDNCGACDRVCASGICTAGHCQGELSGHIVAIGHDYQRHHAAMARVLGNSISLGAHPDVGVARWRGTASEAASAGTSQAIASSMTRLGRPWHPVALPATPSTSALDGVDVLVIDAQTGDGDAAQAAAAPWATTVDLFLQRGGVVIVLHGAADASHRFARGVGLYDVAAPVDSTNVPAVVIDGSDAIAQQVLSPYLAETTSVVFPGVGSPVIATMTGGALVFHRTRY